MKRNFRLTKTRDFRRIKKEGISKQHKFAVLVYIKNGLDFSRTAFIASKAVGNAVSRNRIKRRMRACVANEWINIKPGWDLVFYARIAGEKAGFDDLQIAVHQLLLQAGLVKDNRINVN